MATIYTDAQGRQVYDLNGQTIDAKTGQPVSGVKAAPDPFATSNPSIAYGAVNTNPAPTAAPAAAPAAAPTSYTNPNAAPYTPPSQYVGPDAQSGPAQASKGGYGFGLGGFQSPQKGDINFSVPGGGESSLLSFANALTAATNFAKQKRNASSLAMMAPFQGTLAASDFSGILSRINAASDNTSSSLIKNAMDAATPKYVTQEINGALYQLSYDASGRFTGGQKIADIPNNASFTYGTATDPQGNTWELQYKNGQMVGQRLASSGTGGKASSDYDIRSGPGGSIYAIGVDEKGNPSATPLVEAPNGGKTFKTEQIGSTLYQYEVDSNGQIVGTPKVVVKGSSSTTEKFSYSTSDFNDDKQALDASRGSDGYVNSEKYLALYDAWISSGGSQADFLKTFPPEDYVNPNDPTVPPYLKPKDTYNPFQ